MARAGSGEASAPASDAIPVNDLKDLRRGSKLGNLSGHAPEETSVTLGTGMLDFPAILHEAARGGVKRYYIEDEAPEALSNISVSLKYLKPLGF